MWVIHTAQGFAVLIRTQWLVSRQDLVVKLCQCEIYPCLSRALNFQLLLGGGRLYGNKGELKIWPFITTATIYEMLGWRFTVCRVIDSSCLPCMYLAITSLVIVAGFPNIHCFMKRVVSNVHHLVKTKIFAAKIYITWQGGIYTV